MSEADLLARIIEHFEVFILVLMRIGGMFFLMPVFSGAAIPPQAKVVMAMAAAMLLTPIVAVSRDLMPQSAVGFLLYGVTELFAGMTLALMLRLVFAGLQTAAQMAGFQMGLSMANIMDPNAGAQSLVVAELVYMASLTLLLAVNGHHLILSAVVGSFDSLPIGTLKLSEPLFNLIMGISREMFVLSVKLMAPVMAILLFSQAALGILARVVPQMNLLMLSFSLNIGLGLFFLGLTMQLFWPVLSKSLNTVLKLMPVALRLMGGQ
jgi:flagellar biosynthetic protein FliR